MTDSREPGGTFAPTAEERLPELGQDVGMRHIDLLGMRVLVVEDSYLVAFDLRNELVRYGADVIGPVGTLDMAFDLANSEPRIDAAVIDINLHGEFAFPLVDQLVRSDIPVVFCTGYNREVVPYRLRHIVRYTKPVRPSEIAQGIVELILDRRSREE